jgi:type IV pilus assembly protein PilA
MKQFHFSFSVVSLVKFLFVVTLTILVVTQSRYAYDGYKIRQQVNVGLNLAAPAKVIVEGNAAKGRALNSGWVLLTSRNDIVVAISQDTGIITVVYGSDVDGGGRTLTLVPVHAGQANGYAFSGNAVSSSILPPASRISWVCASADTITRNATVLEHKGTLRSKYTPLECRR